MNRLLLALPLAAVAGAALAQERPIQLTIAPGKAAAEDRAEHTVDRRNDGCLMWTASAGQRITVAGAWTVRKAGAK